MNNLNWKEVRKSFPNKWVIVEATKAHSNGSKRFLDLMNILNATDDSKFAFHEYKHFHHSHPEKELYVLYTGKEELEVIERKWAGIRTASLT